MKEIMAIIRMNMINRTREALTEAGIFSMTALAALGRGVCKMVAQTSRHPISPPSHCGQPGLLTRVRHPLPCHVQG